MKNTLITFLLILLCRQVDAQYQALQIGDKVPDFEFAIQNYKTPRAKISDFKGKLVFFDFWSTYCSSCIAGFPKMEKLQKEFGDKIIVILVNMRETQEEVNDRLKARKSTASELNSMPSIIDEQAFAQLFPHRFAGNYVWIGPEGRLLLNSYIPYNIHPKKIKEALAGKEITFLKPGEQYGLTKNEPTLLNIVNDSNTNNLDIYSLLCPVNLNYYPVGGQKLNQKDSILNTVRNTYVNRTFVELYLYALKESLDTEWKSKIFGPNIGTNHYLDYFKILVKDSSLYDDRLLSKANKTDEYVTRSLYCYEQVLPQSTAPALARSYMREDLDRYFGLRYGSKVTIESVEIPCYIWRLVPNHKRLPDTELKKKLKYLNKGEFSTVRTYEDVMSAYFRAVENCPYVFTEGNSNQKIKIVMPIWHKSDSLEDFQAALKLNGYDFIKGTKKVKMIVVRE